MIVAIGDVQTMVDYNWIKPGAVVIDVAINEVEVSLTSFILLLVMDFFFFFKVCLAILFMFFVFKNCLKK